MPFARELPGFDFCLSSNLRTFLAFKSVQVYLVQVYLVPWFAWMKNLQCF